MEKSDKVNYVKSELNNYHHMQNKAIQLNFKADELWTRIDRVSGGIAKIPSNNDFDSNWRSPLFEEVEKIEAEIDMLLLRCDKVNRFLDKLDNADRDIIWNLHVSKNDKRRYSDYCQEVYMSKITLFRHVERLILKYW